ncbi:MAG: hypothetical protein J6S91_12065, partial [Treponema sp.]|nr:hypothetical protein [Treponema sp.]
SLFGLFYIGKSIPESKEEALGIYQSGKKYMPYQGIASATMTWAPFDNFNFSFGPYITWLSLSEAPEVALKLSCKLGGGKF